MTAVCMIGTISSILLILIIFVTEENLANPLRPNTSSRLLRSWRQSKSENNQLIDAPIFNKPSHVQLQLDNSLETDEHYYAVADNSAIDSSFQPVIVCNAGNKSGWLICNDPSGKASRSDADQLCQTSGQTLWMYVPSGWLWTKNDYSYWICSKPRENSKI